jgi:hypothetical protein
MASSTKDVQAGVGSFPRASGLLGPYPPVSTETTSKHIMSDPVGTVLIQLKDSTMEILGIEYNDYTSVYTSPILWEKTRTGLTKLWRIHILKPKKGTSFWHKVHESAEEGVPDPHYIQSESWQINKEGKSSKRNLSVPKLIKPKNVGKSNETTSHDQAMSEADSAFNAKVARKGYNHLDFKAAEKATFDFTWFRADEDYVDKHPVNLDVEFRKAVGDFVTEGERIASISGDIDENVSELGHIGFSGPLYAPCDGILTEIFSGDQVEENFSTTALAIITPLGKRSDSKPYPMLAQSYGRRMRNEDDEWELLKEGYSSHRMNFPAFVQAKHDGVRCLTDGVEFWSRTCSPFPNDKNPDPKITEHLELSHPVYYNKKDEEFKVTSAPPEGDDWIKLVFDGELIITGEHFQDTVKATRKYRKELSPLLEYHIFDVVIPDMINEDRYRVLMDFMFYGRGGHEMPVAIPDAWDTVDTEVAEDEEEMLKFHQAFIKSGYEGTIIRDLDGKYAVKQRSPHLQKLKDFMDDEFKIVAFTEGEREPGMVIWICETNEASPKGAGHIFEARPRGSFEDRRDWYENGDAYIGEMLTVAFEGWTKDGLPSKPVGIAIRNYE